MYLKGEVFPLEDKKKRWVSEIANAKNLPLSLASLVAQTVKNLPTMQETSVRSLDQEDPLEEEMAIHSSILA